MSLVEQKNGRASLQQHGPDRSSLGTKALSIDEVWKVIAALAALEPPPSPRPIVGPVLTWLRKCLWRLIGVKRTLRQLATIVSHVIDSRLTFREGTHDRAIWLDVVNNNEYRLPESFSADDIVLDIGMHIGSFCYAALLRGCGNVYGFEADRENFSIAVQNLKMFGDRVHPCHQAVWRSDRTGDSLFFAGYGSNNTGGGTILYNTTGEKLDVIAFDDIIREVTNQGQKRIRMMKIDCEGSEFPILLTSRLLHLVDKIHGEYHNTPVSSVARVEGVNQFTIAELTRYLQEAGFVVNSFAKDNNLGLFFATRG